MSGGRKHLLEGKDTLTIKPFCFRSTQPFLELLQSEPLPRRDKPNHFSRPKSMVSKLVGSYSREAQMLSAFPSEFSAGAFASVKQKNNHPNPFRISKSVLGSSLSEFCLCDFEIFCEGGDLPSEGNS